MEVGYSHWLSRNQSWYVYSGEILNLLVIKCFLFSLHSSAFIKKHVHGKVLAILYKTRRPLINGAPSRLYVLYLHHDIRPVHHDIRFVHLYISPVHLGCYVVYPGRSFLVDRRSPSLVLENEHIKLKLGLRLSLNIKKPCKRSS